VFTYVGLPQNLKDLKIEQAPVSTYGGSLKNLKDLKRAPKHHQYQSQVVKRLVYDNLWPLRAARAPTKRPRDDADYRKPRQDPRRRRVLH